MWKSYRSNPFPCHGQRDFPGCSTPYLPWTWTLLRMGKKFACSEQYLVVFWQLSPKSSFGSARPLVAKRNISPGSAVTKSHVWMDSSSAFAMKLQACSNEVSRAWWTLEFLKDLVCIWIAATALIKRPMLNQTKKCQYKANGEWGSHFWPRNI